MSDPVYALMLMGVLREKYFIWDKEADIDFIKPGTTDLFADFMLSDEVVAYIKQKTKKGEKVFPEFIVNVVDANGIVVSRIRRVLYVRKKPAFREYTRRL